MGFNKRFVTGSGIIAAWENNGIEGVENYFNKPDALFVPSEDCFALYVYELWNERNLTSSSIEPKYQEYVDIYRRIMDLKEQTQLVHEADVIKFLTDKMLDAEKELTYYTR